jgi:Fe(3+) dicitrate transport protein
MLALVVNNAFAQSKGNIEGYIMDEDSQPISGAVVRIAGSNLATFSEANGKFEFRNLAYGTYKLKVSFIGYSNIEKSILLKSGSLILSEIILSKNSKALQEVEVNAARIARIDQIKEEETNVLIGGKKTETISLAAIDADVSQKNARQIFAKIPGVFVYDMDGSGNQINISSRGLDPHRSWEYNVRLDNVVTNSDMYGYPASHFSMPMESIEKIQMIRGTGSLQYGAQFGGMLNYVTKSADSTKKIALESINAVGSYGLKSTYNALGGTVGKFSYYTYFSKRVSDGYRDNAESNYESEYIKINYRFNETWNLAGGLARSVYTYRIPGPLTEEQYATNPRQSSRNRNYYSPDIFVPFLELSSKINKKSSLKLMVSAVLGERKSVQFTGISGMEDVPDINTGLQTSRQVDIDNYHSYTTELSFSNEHSLLNKSAKLHAGVRLIRNDLHRRQKGSSDVDEGAVYTVGAAGFGRDMHYYTDNVAMFLEEKLNLTSNFSVNAGLRFEKGLTKMRGRIDDYPENEVPTDIKHEFPLMGLDFNFTSKDNLRFYGGWSQAYRPVIFADIIPANPYELADKNLHDASGSNMELGLQGKTFDNRLVYNVSVFNLYYKDRMGKQVIIDANGDTFVLRTNIGNSITYGLESYLDFIIHNRPKFRWSVFTASSFMKGKYLNGEVTNGTENVSVDGNLLPGVPQIISRNGFLFKTSRWSFTLQYSYTSSFYSDPLNIEFAENGTVGLVPSYGILDFNTSLKVTDFLVLKGSLSNIGNVTYYTKRPTGYPGPGIWTSDGRSAVLSLGIKI